MSVPAPHPFEQPAWQFLSDGSGRIDIPIPADYVIAAPWEAGGQPADFASKLAVIYAHVWWDRDMAHRLSSPAQGRHLEEHFGILRDDTAALLRPPITFRPEDVAAPSPVLWNDALDELSKRSKRVLNRHRVTAYLQRVYQNLPPQRQAHALLQQARAIPGAVLAERKGLIPGGQWKLPPPQSLAGFEREAKAIADLARFEGAVLRPLLDAHPDADWLLQPLMAPYTPNAPVVSPNVREETIAGGRWSYPVRKKAVCGALGVQGFRSVRARYEYRPLANSQVVQVRLDTLPSDQAQAIRALPPA